MVNGLGVGACDRRPPAVPWARTPYSAVGPGRAGGRVQPVGVCFGGEGGNYFQGIAAGGTFSASAGTSFATPTAARGLANLAARLGARPGLSNTLRAFAAHFAERDKDLQVSDVGYGRLREDYDPVLELEAEEVTVLYEDEIERGSSLALPLPLPADVADGRMIDARWTIAFTAPVDPTDPVDYTLRGLEVAFRPHAGRFRLTHHQTRKAVVLDVQAEPERFVQLLREGFVAGTYPVSRSPERLKNEAVLREEGKWETISRNEVRMRRSGLHDPHVQLTYLSREQGALTPAADPLEFSMLATITAPRGVRLYEAVRQRYRTLQPVTLEVPLQVRA
jgi:hypothetical protein